MSLTKNAVLPNSLERNISKILTIKRLIALNRQFFFKYLSPKVSSIFILLINAFIMRFICFSEKVS